MFPKRKYKSTKQSTDPVKKFLARAVFRSTGPRLSFKSITVGFLLSQVFLPKLRGGDSNQNLSHVCFKRSWSMRQDRMSSSLTHPYTHSHSPSLLHSLTLTLSVTHKHTRRETIAVTISILISNRVFGYLFLVSLSHTHTHSHAL